MIKVSDPNIIIGISFIFGILLLVSVLPYLAKIHPFWRPEKAVAQVKKIIKVSMNEHDINVHRLLEVSIQGQTRFVPGNLFHHVGDVVEVYHTPDLVMRREKPIEQAVWALITLVMGILFGPSIAAMLHDPRVILCYLAVVLLAWIGYPYYFMVTYRMYLWCLENGVVFDDDQAPDPASQKEKKYRIATIAVIVIGMGILGIMMAVYLINIYL